MQFRDLPQPVGRLAVKVAGAYRELPAVRAVALGGSQVSPFAGSESDLDIYVYAERPLHLESRRAVVAARASSGEVGNEFWEPGDEWVDAETGLHLDVMFRDVAWIEGDLERVLVHHQAWVGYSTSFWHNVRTSVVLRDPTGWFANLQLKARGSYPEALRRAIVAKNHPILRNTMSSYRHQIARALERDDSVSVNHRIAALLASYFDILFALNRQTHPGEKRLLDYAREYCALVPDGLESRITELLAGAFEPDHDTLNAIDALIDGLDVLLEVEGLMPEDASGLYDRSRA